MTEEKANQIYDLLVEIGGAAEIERSPFIYYHTNDLEYKHKEWRFCGKLGLGGKYRPQSNTVDCYLEDENPNRLQIIEELNKSLAEFL